MKQKTVAILQSNYIPWKGNFHMMRLVDEYVLYDDVQFTRRDWRNRNKIKTPAGLRWLTIPVKSVSNHQSKECSQLICETEIADLFWAEKHWKIVVTFTHPLYWPMCHWTLMYSIRNHLAPSLQCAVLTILTRRLPKPIVCPMGWLLMPLPGRCKPPTR